MKEWKLKQEVYHRLNTTHKDTLVDKEISLIWKEDDIVDWAIRHWNEKVDRFVYPAKSYCVAICYAKWIERDYGDNFYELLNDPKELSEHLMLLDLGRNDAGKVSKINTVKVTESFIIERYSHVMHIVSNVCLLYTSPSPRDRG